LFCYSDVYINRVYKVLFLRKDKYDIYVNRVNKVPGHDRKACYNNPVYTTGNRTLFNQYWNNSTTVFGTCQATGLTLIGTATDTAECTGAACPTDLALFYNTGKLIGTTDLASLNR
jgi:hypothetical protein